MQIQLCSDRENPGWEKAKTKAALPARVVLLAGSAELTFAKSKADSSAPVRKPCRMEDGKPDRANCRTSMEKSAMVYCSEGNAKSSRAKLRTKNDGPSMALFAASIEHSKLVAPVALRALTVKALPANGVKPKHPSPNMNKLGSVHAKPRKKRVGSVCEK